MQMAADPHHLSLQLGQYCLPGVMHLLSAVALHPDTGCCPLGHLCLHNPKFACATVLMLSYF